MPGPHGRNPGVVKPKNAGKTAMRILQYFGRRKLLLIIVFISLVLTTVCSIGASYWLKPILDDVAITIGEGTFKTVGIKLLGKNLAIVASLYTGAAFFSFIQARIMVKIAYSTTNTIRKDLFDHMQTLPLRFFDGRTHGEVMSRFTNDVDNIQMMLEQTVVQLVSSVFMFIGYIIMLIRLEWRMFIVAFVFLVVMLITSTSIAKKTRKYFKLQQSSLGKMNGNIEESVEGVKVVKVFNHEEAAKEAFDECNEQYRQNAAKASFYSGIMGPCSTGINNASYATNTLNNIFSALAGAERVFEVMDTESEVDEGTVRLEEVADENGKRWYWVDGDERIRVEGKVVFDNVSFSYVEGKQVLHNISLYAKPAQKIAFVGSTGAGKTTITNLINRFYDIQEGSITYDGIDIKRIKKADLRRSLAMVLQDTHLFTGTIMENIRYGRLDATDEECIEAAKLASAHSFIKHFEKGYDTEITGDGDNLSQGQRQLLAIARAAVADPPVMILDEATSSVDTRTEAHIEHGMDRLMVGRTVFVIAHRLSTVRNSNAIMVLENGSIIERGDHADLLEQKGRYYELCTGKAKLA